MHNIKLSLLSIFLSYILSACGGSQSSANSRDNNLNESTIQTSKPIQTNAITQTDSSIQSTTTQINTAISKKILIAFNKHVKSMKEDVHKRLKKDSKGYSDTYVLYDIQGHLQNILILADEHGDTDILKKLLELVSIPFESQYISADGKWIDRKHYTGRESNLAISQFFGLLTRTLDACARHKVPTDTFSKSEKNLKIIHDHISSWMTDNIYYELVSDAQLFYTMSAIHFQEYLNTIKKTNPNFLAWKEYVQNYVNNSIIPLMEEIPCQNSTANQICAVLAKDGWLNKKTKDFLYSAYGTEIKNLKSNTDPYAMFYANGNIKQAEKTPLTGATDISHANRFNWFFESIKRFGTKSFDVSIPEKWIEGWANTLAYKVCSGSKALPYFTIYSDGTDGWYRVGYAGRKGFGYSPGLESSMNIHFVASAYGIMGKYNTKIYTWMQAWADNHTSKIGITKFQLDFLTSMQIDIQKPL